MLHVLWRIVTVTNENFGRLRFHRAHRICLSDPTGFVRLEPYLSRPENSK
jgi:hypothetical protein